MSMPDDEICGFCGQPGADKIPHPMHWPNELLAGTEYVHAECEEEETKAAFAEFYSNYGKAGVKEFLSSIR